MSVGSDVCKAWLEYEKNPTRESAFNLKNTLIKHRGKHAFWCSGMSEEVKSRFLEELEHNKPLQFFLILKEP